MMGMRERFEKQGREEGLRAGQAEGLPEGREEGIQLGEERQLRKLLGRLLASRFGPLDEATQQRLQRAGMEQLDHWTELALSAQSLDEVFRVQ